MKSLILLLTMGFFAFEAKANTLSVACDALENMGAKCQGCQNIQELETCVEKNNSLSSQIGDWCTRMYGPLICGSPPPGFPDFFKVGQAMCCKWNANLPHVKACFRCS